MDTLTCPQCGAPMTERSLGHARVRRCDDCDGVFLARADLGALIEGETDWHAHQSANTATLPRITASMPEPPVAKPRSRAFVEALFQA